MECGRSLPWTSQSAELCAAAVGGGWFGGAGPASPGGRRNRAGSGPEPIARRASRRPAFNYGEGYSALRSPTTLHPTLDVNPTRPGPPAHRSMPASASAHYQRNLARLSPNRPAALVAVLVLPVLYLSGCAAYRYTDLLNPTVMVEVEHPPTVGFVVDQVVFASGHSPSLLESLGFSGPTSQARCEAELVQALTQVLIEGGLQVAHAESGGDADGLITVQRYSV